MIIVRGADFVAGGPKGRHEIATSVRAWSGWYPKVSQARRADTSHCVNLSCRAFGAQLILIGSRSHDLTVVATSSRPFGPQIKET
jgi:hypothetical protein